MTLLTFLNAWIAILFSISLPFFYEHLFLLALPPLFVTSSSSPHNDDGTKNLHRIKRNGPWRGTMQRILFWSSMLGNMSGVVSGVFVRELYVAERVGVSYQRVDATLTPPSDLGECVV